MDLLKRVSFTVNSVEEGGTFTKRNAELRSVYSQYGLPDMDGVVVTAGGKDSWSGGTPHDVRDRKQMSAMYKDRGLLLPHDGRRVGGRGDESAREMWGEPAGCDGACVSIVRSLCSGWRRSAKVEETHGAAGSARDEIERLEWVDVDGVAGVGLLCGGWEFDAG